MELMCHRSSFGGHGSAGKGAPTVFSVHQAVKFHEYISQGVLPPSPPHSVKQLSFAGLVPTPLHRDQWRPVLPLAPGSSIRPQRSPTFRDRLDRLDRLDLRSFDRGLRSTRQRLAVMTMARKGPLSRLVVASLALAQLGGTGLGTAAAVSMLFSRMLFGQFWIFFLNDWPSEEFSDKPFNFCLPQANGGNGAWLFSFLSFDHCIYIYIHFVPEMHGLYSEIHGTILVFRM